MLSLCASPKTIFFKLTRKILTWTRYSSVQDTTIQLGEICSISKYFITTVLLGLVVLGDVKV